MEYFVTFTVLRSATPKLFISGSPIDGRGRVEETLAFESKDQLRNRLEAAELPTAIVDSDLPSPLLVHTEQMKALGLSRLY